MKTFKYLLPAICLFFVLESCRSVRQVSQTKETISESINIKRTSYKDTVFYTEKSTANLKIPITDFTFLKSDLNGFSKPFKSDLKTKIYEQKNGNASVKAVFDSTGLQVFAECDSLALKAQIRQEFELKENKRQTLAEKEEKEKQKANYWMWGSLVAIAFIAGFIISKFT